MAIFFFHFQPEVRAVDDVETAEDMESMTGQRAEAKFVAHVSVPTQKQIEQALLQRKKQALLSKYADDTI